MINDRQFYISIGNTASLSDWKTIPILDNKFFHYHKGLQVFHVIAHNIILAGHAWQVDPERKSPQEELLLISQKQDISRQDVFNIEKSWCGRYVLLVDEWLYLDATGSLGIFYSDKTISCSLNIIRTLENRDYKEPGFTYRVSPDYFPGIHTPYVGVDRVMPSQILNYVSCQTINRPLLIDKIPTGWTDQELIKTFSKFFVHSVKNFASVFFNHKIWFALSAGRDSRTALALYEKAGINFSCFTLQHKWISLPDRVLPKRLAKAINKEYRYIKRRKSLYSKQRFDDYKAHTAGMAKDADWLFYAYDQYQELRRNGEDIVLVRSGIWETPEEFYTVAFGDKSKDLNQLFPGVLSNEVQYKSLYDWYDMVQKDKCNKNISFECRMVWELSQGCWLSSIEQSFDMMEGTTSVQPLNCRLFLGLLLGFNVEDRHKKQHEERIAIDGCPIFATIPYDYQYVPSISQRIDLRLKKLMNFFRVSN